jgi:hypothetical protein
MIRTLWLALVLVPVLVGCPDKSAEPRHRERDASRDRECREPTKPHAYFYPADNRTDYKPDHPERDGCALLVADHLFCCPNRPRDTDR